MSSLWTPSGEHFPREGGGDDAPPRFTPTGDTDVTDPSHDISHAEAQAEVDAMRAQLAHTPAEVLRVVRLLDVFEVYYDRNAVLASFERAA